MTIIAAKEALLPEGWARDVFLKISADGRISEVGTGAVAADWRVDLALPAAVNLHSHTFQRAMAGLTERRGEGARDSFWTWRRLMYRFLDRLDPGMVEAIAGLAFMEMAEAGYAGVAEFHYLHHRPDGAPYPHVAEMSERIVAASVDAGLGLTLLPVHYAQGGCDGRALEGGQRRFGNDPGRFATLLDGAAVAVRSGHADGRLGAAPHSLRAVPPADLEAVAALRPGDPVHIHVAEQVAEVEEVSAAYGARPVEWLLDRASVDARWCLVHATQMTPAETAALARTGAVAGLCPITEANLGDGIFDGARYLGAGGRLGVGTDSNVDVSLFGELAMLEYSQRLRDRARAVLAGPGQSVGRCLYGAALAGGAQAAGRESGALAVGHWADILGVSMEDARIAGRSGDVALDALIFGGAGVRSVREVWSAGRHIVTSGRHVARERIVARFRETMRALEDTL